MCCTKHDYTADSWLRGIQGLGKTITGLALISKTRRTLPEPPVQPDGTPVKCTWVKDPTGRPAAFYTGVVTLLYRQPLVGIMLSGFGASSGGHKSIDCHILHDNTVPHEAHRCLRGSLPFIWLSVGVSTQTKKHIMLGSMCRKVTSLQPLVVACC